MAVENKYENDSFARDMERRRSFLIAKANEKKARIKETESSNGAGSEPLEQLASTGLQIFLDALEASTSFFGIGLIIAHIEWFYACRHPSYKFSLRKKILILAADLLFFLLILMSLAVVIIIFK